MAGKTPENIVVISPSKVEFMLMTTPQKSW